MTYPIFQRELTLHLNNGNWYLRPIEGTEILGPVDYGWHRFNSYPDSFTFGEGLLAGSSIPGSRRLIFCAWSPQWEGFYVSSMGGAAYTFHRLGLSYVALRGRAHTKSVLILNHREGEVRVRLEPVNVEVLWSNYADPQGHPLTGFYALQQALYDRYAGEYSPDCVRIFAVGPAALYTQEGVIGSSPVRKGVFDPIEDWAGRGGLGSRLLQYHNIAGCIFGGDWEDPDLRDSAEIDAYFLEQFGKKTIQTDISVTQKYRYVPEFETGGTFGVNMHQMYAGLMSFNYQSIYATNEARLRQHEDFILKHYLAQFNEETIKPKNFLHCGEPCPVVCKKYRDIYKKDYEPYHALGPQVGVFDQRAAEQLNHHVDAMGLDSIQCGGTLAWIMELVAERLINPLEFNLPPATELKFTFIDDVNQFNLEKDSLLNAKYAMVVVDAILFEPKCDLFRRGIRAAAQELDKTLGINSVDRAVYLAHGENGYMVPNQYWVPGMLSPMPIMGKYYSFYELEFFPPEVLGRKNVERMTYELFSDNSGICRFHRKWAELITDEILAAHYNLTVDYKAHQFDLAQSIYNRECTKAVPWESTRLADLILGYLEHWELGGLKDSQLEFWLSEFRKDKVAAARTYWQAIQRGIAEAFAAGVEAIPTQLTPKQSKKI